MATYPVLSDSVIEDIKSRLSYNPDTGIVSWATSVSGNNGKPWRADLAGKEAGASREDGYRSIAIGAKSVLAHRIAWILHYGVNPPAFVDHVNGNKSDNRISNLRLATKAQNGFNKGKAKANTSGWKGVYLHRKSGLWTSRIRVNGSTISLGYFRDLKEAAEAYIFAALEHHGEYARLE